jgi:hypothetical protein
MSLQGNLADLSFAELLQGLAASRRTGALFLYRGKAQGAIHLGEGRVLDASVEGDGRLEGEEAFYRLACWSDGRFDFRPGAAPARKAIERDLVNLLMEAARRQDERREIERRVPAAAVPAFAPDLPRDEVDLNTREWGVMEKIDGARSVEAIARECGRPLADVQRLLDGPLAGRLITLAAPAGDGGPETVSSSQER